MWESGLFFKIYDLDVISWKPFGFRLWISRGDGNARPPPTLLVDNTDFVPHFEFEPRRVVGWRHIGMKSDGDTRRSVFGMHLVFVLRIF